MRPLFPLSNLERFVVGVPLIVIGVAISPLAGFIGPLMAVEGVILLGLIVRDVDRGGKEKGTDAIESD